MAPSLPTRVEGVDVLALPLNPLEGFVLSRVDGCSTVDDIAIMCGVDSDQARNILERLAKLGAIHLSWGVAESQPTEVERTAGAAAPTSIASPDEGTSLLERLYGESAPPLPLDLSDLEIEVQIDLPTRRRILRAHYLTDTGTFYELLGVSQSAEKTEIRAAYFELSKAFHPDVFFGRELGPFRAKTETVFQRLTEAYETLSRKKRRAEYDAYVGAAQRIQRAEEAVMEPEPVTLAEPQQMAEVSVVEAPSTISVRPRKSIDERRAATADRVRQRFASLSNMAAQRGAVAAAPERSARISDSGIGRESAVDDLRRALRASSSRAPVGLHTLVEEARAAEKAGDFPAAMKCVRHVLLLDASNEQALELRRRIEPAYEKQLLADYVAQATYQERNGKWQAAATSWMFVAEKVPTDHRAARQAALALLRSNGDPHKARTYAETAVHLQAHDVDNLIVLARVYLAAGHKLNARRVLEKAVKLDPQNALITTLLDESNT